MGRQHASASGEQSSSPASPLAGRAPQAVSFLFASPFSIPSETCSPRHPAEPGRVLTVWVSLPSVMHHS